MNILNSKSKLLNLVIAGFPRPPASMAGLSVEELRTMEGIERENIEARIQWLRDIQSLLDGAMLLINQYNTVTTNSRYVFIHAIFLPSADSRRAVVSYKRKYVHRVLVNHLG